ncbi:hypothetical protein FA13DRAFT_1796170 [Coprinellus micaceus]|uniref:Uncharacterized protein n=1 Tax=Coprinellus micaceus TaxID=71717 RepID=A0A4Y7SW60_COPMI|nr:hypothetical protein FA13DRAFT_1796170 [Coprinellus micaceus]
MHCGENIIAAVNVPIIPELPATGNRKVFMCWDLHYGADNYIQWPQPFHRKFPHFAAILHKPKYSHTLKILWKSYHAQCPEFTTSTAHYVLFCPYDLSAFKNVETQLGKQVADYLEDPRSKSPESYREAILIRRGWAHTFLARITTIPMTCRELWHCLIKVQRFLLKLHAALYWETICMPCILGLEQLATTVVDMLGTLTLDPGDVKPCVVAGLPVWLILDVDHLPHTRIDKVVEFEPAALHVIRDQGTIKNPVIF